MDMQQMLEAIGNRVADTWAKRPPEYKMQMAFAIARMWLPLKIPMSMANSMLVGTH